MLPFLWLLRVELGRRDGPFAHDLHDDFFVLRHVVVVAEGGLVDEAARLHRRHLLGIVGVALRSERHPPRAFDYRDVARLVVIVRVAPLARSEAVPRDIDPWLL